MNARRLTIALAAAVMGCTFGIVSAQLPAQTEEQAAKAAEAKAKAAEAAKRDAELLGRSQDRAVENYKRGSKVQNRDRARSAQTIQGRRGTASGL